MSKSETNHQSVVDALLIDENTFKASLINVKTILETNTMSIRLATQNDIPDIVRINETCLPENYDMDTYHKHLEIYNLTYVCCDMSGQINGYIMGRIEDGVEVHVTSIAVMPDMRGSKLGQRLLLTMLVAAKQKGLKGCSLQVRKSNEAAIHIYKKLGFQPIRDLDNYYGDEDGVFMRRRIAG